MGDTGNNGPRALGKVSGLVGKLSELTDLSTDAIKLALSLTEKLCGKPASVAGELLADHIYAWQVANRIRVIDRFRRIVEEKNIPLLALPPGFVLDALEAAQRVEDPALQEMWARLLAGATRGHVHPMFVDALRRLSSADARVFDQLAQMSLEHGTRAPVVICYPWDEWDDHAVESIHRLRTIGLVDFHQRAGGGYVVESQNELWMTAFGRQLHAALNSC